MRNKLSNCPNLHQTEKGQDRSQNVSPIYIVGSCLGMFLTIIFLVVIRYGVGTGGQENEVGYTRSTDRTSQTFFGGGSQTSGRKETLTNQLAKQARVGIVQIHAYSKEKESTGTGVVVAKKDSQLLILTNSHVIVSEGELAEHIIIKSKSQKECHAQVVAIPKDGRIDLTLLLVGDMPELSPIWPIASSDQLSEGDKVIAIGHPLEFDFSITDGICSAKRDVKFAVWIQHTAPINPGNSGGPLFDPNGAIVGINTFVREDSQGIFIAFPADYIFKESQWEYLQSHESLIKALLKSISYIQ